MILKENITNLNIIKIKRKMTKIIAKCQINDKEVELNYTTLEEARFKNKNLVNFRWKDVK